MKDQKGFTLIELVVVIAIIAMLAGMFVVPNVMGTAERGRLATANTDVNTIQQAIDSFTTNRGELPNRKDASNKNYYLLIYSGQKSDGTPLTEVMMEDEQGVDKSQAGVLDIVNFPLANRDNLYHHLAVNDRSYPDCKEKKDYGWCGSYLKLKDDMLDPWGNSYFVFFIDQGDDTTRVFILSAGPDKALDTDPASDAIVNPDDIGVTWITQTPK